VSRTGGRLLAWLVEVASAVGRHGWLAVAALLWEVASVVARRWFLWPVAAGTDGVAAFSLEQKSVAVF